MIYFSPLLSTGYAEEVSLVFSPRSHVVVSDGFCLLLWSSRALVAIKLFNLDSDLCVLTAILLSVLYLNLGYFLDLFLEQFLFASGHFFPEVLLSCCLLGLECLHWVFLVQVCL